MKMTTEQEEAEAAKAAATDSAAMEKLLEEVPVEEEVSTQQEQEPAPPVAETKPSPEPAPPEPPPPRAEPAPPADLKPKDTPAEQDEFEKNLGSDKYELPVGATKQAREIIKIVKGQASEQHKLYMGERTAKETLQKQFDEMQSKLASATKDSEELARYRPIVERMAIEHDPKFNARYGNRLAEIEGGVLQNLVSWGLPEKTAEYIAKNGGPSYFSRDSTSQCPAENEDGSEGDVRMSHKQFWEQRILSQLSDERKDKVRLAFDDAIRVRDGRETAMRNALANRAQYFKEMEAESKRNEETFKAAVTKTLAEQRKELADIAAEREIPKDATPELKKEIEEHNAVIKDASAKFDQLFFDTSPEALVRKTLGGLLLDHMKGMLGRSDAKTAAVQAKLDALQKKWDASVKAANTSQRQSVQQTAKPVQGIETERNDGLRMEKMLEQLPA